VTGGMLWRPLASHAILAVLVRRPEVPLSHGHDRKAPRPPSNEGLRLLDSGPVAETSEDAGGTEQEDGGSDRSRQAGLAERGSSDSRSIPDNARDRRLTEPVSVQTEVVGFTWSAPLPTPADLGEYERLVPGSALRILAMTENLISGPIDNDTKLTDAEIDASNRGLSFAMRLTAAMALAAVVFFALGVAGVGNVTASVTAGSVCLSVPVVMLIRSFITRS
jgi:uncharacterized membrane protein